MSATDGAGAGTPGGAEELAARLAGFASSLPGFAFQRRQAADGTFSYPWISDGVTAVLGFSAGEMKVNSQGCLQVVHWADRDGHLAAIRRSAADLSQCAEEFRAIDRMGDVRWLKGASRPRRLGDGTLAWDGVLIDVTDGVRAELRLDMLMDHASDGILVIDAEGAIDSANTAAERLFGAGHGGLVGKAFAALLADPPAGGPEVLAGGEPRELTARRGDGASFPIELSTSEVRLGGHRLFVAIGRDVTQRRRTEAELRESQQRLAAIADNMPGMIFRRVLHTDGRLEYTYVSEGCRTFLDIEPEELMANPQLFLDALSSDERGAFLAALGVSAQRMEPLEEEMNVIGADGRRRWLRGQSRPNRRDNGDIVWDGVMIDVTGRKNAEQRLSFLAYFDPLTRLPNRAAFLERFAEAREHAVRQGALIGLVSLGIDRFGVVNATMGHAAGDRVLIAAADLLQAGLGPGDMMARASGDRFLLMITGHSSRRDLLETVERLHRTAQTVVDLGDNEFEISASAGLAVYPRDGEDADTLLRNADAALQRAKTEGTGTLSEFSKEMSARAARTLTLLGRLRRGLEHGEFIPYFQPQVDLASGAVVGMEALVRWNSPDGMVSPGDFIPIAEDSGLIDGICEHMLLQCARQNRTWQDQGLPAIPVAVNVSGRQFHYSRRLIAALEDALAQSGLDPSHLEIELTESSAMTDADNAIAVVHQIREMGIAAAIDDFGTGYSSLSVLKRFPIQKLKIDRSFVMDVLTDPNDAAIVDAIIAMAKALKLKVIAEGVEHIDHLEFLRSLGCDQMQGYLFSRPLPAAEMGRLLAEGRRLDLAPVAARAPAMGMA